MGIQRTINKNSVSLAGEFAVLSQLALRGFDANITLGHTKGVDILVSDSQSGRMLRLEVKTSYLSTRASGGSSKLFGNYEHAWMMSDKHETLTASNLFYAFVNISKDTKHFRYFIVPSAVVAKYVAEQHKYWVSQSPRTRGGTNSMRQFRIGRNGEKYPIPTPLAEDYEDNWLFRA